MKKLMVKKLSILKPSYVINMYFKVQTILNRELSKSRSYHGKFMCTQLSLDSHSSVTPVSACCSKS